MKLNTIVLVILLVGLSSCVKEVSQPIEPSVLKKLKLVPEDPQIIIYYNHKRVKSLPNWSKFLQENLGSKLQQKTIFDSLGIDFNKDVEEIIVASEWNGNNTYILTVKDTSGLHNKFFDFRDKFFFEFIDSKIIFITNDVERIKKIKLNENDVNFFKNPNFRRIINSILYKEHFWIYTSNLNFLLNIMRNGIKDDAKLNSLLNSIKFINLSLRLDKDVSFSSHWECIDNAKAYLLRGILNGLISALALAYPDDLFIQELSMMDVYVENNGVETVLKISRKKIEQLRKSVINEKIKRMVEHGE